MLLFIGRLSPTTLRCVPICQGFSHFSGFLHHFVSAKLGTCLFKYYMFRQFCYVQFWFVLELIHSGTCQNVTILVRTRIGVIEYKMTGNPLISWDIPKNSLVFPVYFCNGSNSMPNAVCPAIGTEACF